MASYNMLIHPKQSCKLKPKTVRKVAYLRYYITGNKMNWSSSSRQNQGQVGDIVTIQMANQEIMLELWEPILDPILTRFSVDLQRIMPKWPWSRRLKIRLEHSRVLDSSNDQVTSKLMGSLARYLETRLDRSSTYVFLYCPSDSTRSASFRNGYC